jgi:exodeoxyribonuclease VII small subunit
MKKQLNFEEKMLRLEGIQEKMDSGDLSLEENSKLFDEAQEHVKSCRVELEKAQLKVSKVVGNTEEEFES